MRVWVLAVTMHLIAFTANAQSIDDDIVDVGNRFFMREEAVDLLFSDHGDLGRSFSCSGGNGFVAQQAGTYEGICTIDDDVYAVSATTWPRTSRLQYVTVCNLSVAIANNGIPLAMLREGEIESQDWEIGGKVVGKVRYLGRSGGWFSDDFDNVLLDGTLFEMNAVCWKVKSPKQ